MRTAVPFGLKPLVDLNRCLRKSRYKSFPCSAMLVRLYDEHIAKKLAGFVGKGVPPEVKRGLLLTRIQRPNPEECRACRAGAGPFSDAI